MVFKKAKMLARLESEGRSHLVNGGALEIMDRLDGKKATKNDFKALVHGEEEYFVTVNGTHYPVNKLDCE